MADKLGEHLKLEAQREGTKKMTHAHLKKSSAAKKKVKPMGEGNQCSSTKNRGESSVKLTQEEHELIKPLTFVSGGTLCTGPPRSITITGLSAAAARMIGLNASDLSKIKREFTRMDVDNSKEISVGEFIEFMHGIESDFVKDVCHRMIFGFTDLDGDGMLSFNEFVLGVILLSTFSKDQIMYIMFEMFDNNGNNYVEKSEFAGLAKSVDELAGNLFPGNYNAFCQNFDSDGDGLINFDEFMKINDNFPMIFFPPLRMQDVMRSHTLGTNKWQTLTENFDKATKKRIEKNNTKGRGVPLKVESFYEQILVLSTKKGVVKKGGKAKRIEVVDPSSPKNGSLSPKSPKTGTLSPKSPNRNKFEKIER